MAETPGFFTDGEGYERLMGRWSRAAGAIFLDELGPADVERLEASPRECLPTDRDGRTAYMAWADAVKGRVPR